MAEIDIVLLGFILVDKLNFIYNYMLFRGRSVICRNEPVSGAKYGISRLRERVLTYTPLILIIFLGCVVFATTALADVTSENGSGDPDYEYDISAYYVWGSMGGIPAYGKLGAGSGAPVGTVYDLDFNSLDHMSGYGVSANVRRILASDRFIGFGYTGFFTDDKSSTRASDLTADSIYAGLLDRTMADDVLNSDFDDGRVDAASESIDIRRHHLDFVTGRKQYLSPGLETYWQVGFRAAVINLDRDVLYQNLDAGAYSSSKIDLNSDMVGIGPTVGVGSTIGLTNTGWTLKATASASLQASRFDLRRSDIQYEQALARTGRRSVDMAEYGVVPMFGGSLELSRDYGDYFFSLGYTISAALGGGRTLLANGNDDVDGDTANYNIESNDIINQGIYARFGINLGPHHGGHRAFITGDGRLVVDGRIYYAWGALGGTPGFGTLTPGAAAYDYDLDYNSLDDLDGYGLSIDVRRLVRAGQFYGIGYSGFFTDATSRTGSASVDTNSVYAGLLDRSFADDTLNNNVDDGQVDAAKESVEIKQQQVDLVFGDSAADKKAWLGSAWHAGIRVANIDLTRDILYENLNAGVYQSADISLRSDMLGVGPTFGGESTIRLSSGGWSLSGAASASLLAGWFDLSRKDLYKADPASSAMRNVSLDTFGFVPMLDASVELSKRFGRSQLGIGYTFSAALGGGRTLVPAGYDDVDGTTTPYAIEKNDVINHGFFARYSYALGGPNPSYISYAPDWAETELYAMVYRAWSRMEGTPGYGELDIGAPSYTYDLDYNSLDDISGVGINIGARRRTASGGFFDVSYTGVFTDSKTHTGDATVDTNTVYTSLLDRSLANAVLNNNFDDGKADAARDSVKIRQNYADLIVQAESSMASWMDGSLHFGVRVASVGIDRDVLYQNLNGATSQSADIDLNSNMIGLGPVVGAGASLKLGENGLVLKGTASAALLASYYDLSRTDVYKSGVTTGTRNIDINSYGLVPMFEGSLELGKTVGNFHAGIGVTVSAALDAGRTIITSGNDDVDGNTSPYSTEGNDIIDAGVFAKVQYRY